MGYDLHGSSLTVSYGNTNLYNDPNTYTDNGVAATITLVEPNASGTLEEAPGALFDGTGSLSVAFQGPGTFILLGFDPYSGSTTLLGGTVALNNSGTLGTGTIRFNSGTTLSTLRALSNVALSQALQFSANTFSSLDAASGATFTSTGSVDIESVTIHVNDAAADTGTVALGATSATVKAGSGLSLDRGTLKVLTGFANVLNQLQATDINGVLDMNGQNVTLNGLSGSGTIENSGSSGGALTIQCSSTATETFAGSILNVASVHVTGTGVLDLTGDDALTTATIDAASGLFVGPTGAHGTFSGNVSDSGVLLFHNGNALTYSGSLSGAGQLYALGAGGLTLTGDSHNFTGVAYIDGPTTLANASALNNAILIFAAAGPLEAAVSWTNSQVVTFGAAALLEAKSGVSLFLNGNLDFAHYPAQLHFGSAADTGTVVLSGSFLNVPASAPTNANVFEIDGGTLIAASDLSLAGVPVVFKGAPGKLVLQYTANVLNASSAAGGTGSVLLNSAQINFGGANEAVQFGLGTNNVASLHDTANTWDNVTGANGTVNLSNAFANVTGANEIVNFQGASGNFVDLIGSANTWDNVHGGNGQIDVSGAFANIYDKNNSVYFEPLGKNFINLINSQNTWDNVYNGTLFDPTGNIDVTNAFVNVNGQNNNVYFQGTSGNIVNMINSNNTWDNVSGGNGQIDVTNAFVNIYDKNNNVYFQGSTGNFINLINSANTWDNVHGGNGYIDVTNAFANIFDQNNTVLFQGSSGNFVNLIGAGTTADTVDGSTGSIDVTNSLATINGNSDNVFLLGGSDTVTLSGASDTVALAAGLGGVFTVSGFASSDVLQFSKSDFANYAALAASHDLTETGGNTVVTLGADKITIAGATLASTQFAFV